uniref:Uncharacterized protein n=1 Tax=Anguilla anguilla TaxID=7936 RepID=A0A0E9RBA1_ANGAN
MHNSFTYKEL